MKKHKGLINTICGTLMVTTAALYVGLGLALDLWRTAWWVFAVAGILWRRGLHRSGPLPE